jgi:hypothetical protein
VETRPTYLHMTEDLYAGADPGLYIASPPLRTARDVEAIWRGLTDGDIDVLGSDHSVLNRAQKANPELTLKTRVLLPLPPHCRHVFSAFSPRKEPSQRVPTPIWHSGIRPRGAECVLPTCNPFATGPPMRGARSPGGLK